MTAESEAFEKLNQRIGRLLQGPEVSVEWNATIPDPDSPSDSRQIDVLIKSKDGKRTSIECRERKSAQCVMWIEELIGRKLSLGLDGMIAVSVNGFTELARTKADRYGIALYDFDKLSDLEIKSWGGSAHVESIFVQFLTLEIVAGISKNFEGILSPAPDEPKFLYGGADGFAAVQNALRDDVAMHPGQTRTHRIDPNGYTIDGIPLTLLNCGYEGQLVTQNASCTYVALVDTPGVKRHLRSTLVQKFDHSVPEILHHEGEAHLRIDVSNVRVPDNAILHELRVIFPESTTVTQYELVGERKMLSRANSITLNIATTT